MGTWPDSRRQTGTSLLLCSEPVDRTGGSRTLPEFSDRRKRPQQRNLLHCFCTFSFRAQWKMKMKRPAQEDQRDTFDLSSAHRGSAPERWAYPAVS